MGLIWSSNHYSLRRYCISIHVQAVGRVSRSQHQMVDQGLNSYRTQVPKGRWKLERVVKNEETGMKETLQGIEPYHRGMVKLGLTEQWLRRKCWHVMTFPPLENLWCIVEQLSEKGVRRLVRQWPREAGPLHSMHMCLVFLALGRDSIVVLLCSSTVLLIMRPSRDCYCLCNIVKKEPCESCKFQDFLALISFLYPSTEPPSRKESFNL